MVSHKIISLTDEQTYLLLGDYFRQYLNDYKYSTMKELKEILERDWILEFFDNKEDIINQLLDAKRRKKL